MMAPVSPAVVQNDNLDTHRGKGAPKPVKTARKKRKASRDLSEAGKPAAKKYYTLEDTCIDTTPDPAMEAKIREWAEEGIDYVNCCISDFVLTEAQQQSIQIIDGYSTCCCGLEHTLGNFDTHVPVKDILVKRYVSKEFEQNDILDSPEMPPPTPTELFAKAADDELTTGFKCNLDCPVEHKLKEEYDSDTPLGPLAMDTTDKASTSAA